MTTDNSDGPTVSSAEEFETAISELVEAAVEAGVDVRGAQEVTVDGAPQNFEVMISALVGSGDSSE